MRGAISSTEDTADDGANDAAIDELANGHQLHGVVSPNDTDFKWKKEAPGASGSRSEEVPNPTHRADPIRRRRIELLSQFADPHVDGPIEPVVLNAAKLLYQGVATPDFPSSGGEEPQQIKLSRGEIHCDPCNGHPTSTAVDDQ